MLNIETANVVYTLKMLRVVKLVAFFYCHKVNNTRHNKYNSSPVEGICDV